MKQKRVIKCIFLIAALILLGSNIEAKKKTVKDIKPLWLIDKEAAYPASKYVSRIAENTEEEQARATSITRIAEYFFQEISSNTLASQTMKSEGEGKEVSITQELTKDSVIKTCGTLRGVETLTYFNKEDNKYYCLSYIEKEKAFNEFNTTIDKIKAEFYALLQTAKEEKDDLLRLTYLNNANSYVSDLEKNIFMALCVSKDSSYFDSDLLAIKKLTGDRKLLLSSIAFSIKTEGDIKNTVYNALVAMIKKAGCRVQEGAKYTVDASILTEEGEESAEDSPTLYFLQNGQLTLNIYSGDATYFTFDKKIKDKCLSYKKNKMEEKILTALTKATEEAESGFFTFINGEGEVKRIDIVTKRLIM